MTRVYAVGLLAVAGLILSGCNSSAGTGQPAPTVSDSRAGAPLIQRPRDLTSRATDPCDTLLSSAQLGDLGFRRPGVYKVNALGPTCRWEAAGAGSRSIEASVVVTRDLFLDTYAARALPIFKPGEVGGLPSVDSQTSESDPACTTTVGVADGQTLDVSSARGTRSGERDVDACAISRRAAEEIVSTLPPL